jgi:type IV secretory pathway TraG/TraD family ATPase VirD4
MSWDSLSHGTGGLILSYATSLIPFMVILIRKQVRVRGLLISLLIAIPVWIVGGLAGEILASVLRAPQVGGDWARALVIVAMQIFVSVAAALWLLRRQPETVDAHKRGTVLVQAARPAAPPIGTVTLAGAPLDGQDEVKHIKIIGTTGSGKSTAIRELLTGALARGDRAIIADPDGSYAKRFYRPARGDRILNPFDERSARWDLFAEIDQPYDIEQLARSLIPEGPDASGHEWRSFARTFLGAVMEYCKTEGKTDLAELYRLLAVAEPEELQELLAGSAAQPLLAGSDSRMFRAIRGTATPVFNALRYAKGVRSGDLLSIRHWIREGRGVLFLPYTASQIAALKGLIATWMRLAIFETMNLGEGDHRLWFVVDELDALGQIDGLKDALARLRKFGGRCVIGFQSIAQVRGTYGETDANTIVENCGTTLILRCSASERGGTAEFASRLIGKREVVRRHISRSRSISIGGGPHPTETTSDHHTVEDAVMASQIEQLPDLSGFLKIARAPYWQSVRIELPPNL